MEVIPMNLEKATTLKRTDMPAKVNLIITGPVNAEIP